MMRSRPGMCIMSFDARDEDTALEHGLGQPTEIIGKRLAPTPARWRMLERGELENLLRTAIYEACCETCPQWSEEQRLSFANLPIELLAPEGGREAGDTGLRH